MKILSSHIFLFANDHRPMTSGWQRAPHFRRYGRGLVSKPAISFKRGWGGYRRMTLWMTRYPLPVMSTVRNMNFRKIWRRSFCTLTRTPTLMLWGDISWMLWLVWVLGGLGRLGCRSWKYSTLIEPLI